MNEETCGMCMDFDDGENICYCPESEKFGDIVNITAPACEEFKQAK